ncbi:MucBP domain-containing protein, partial [Lacticaseibacillus jixianensis]
MKSRSEISSIRAEADRKVHYKMFKDGKKWVFAGLVTTFFTVLPFVQGNIVQADTTADQGANATAAAADPGASEAKTASSAVLKTSTAAAPTPTTKTVAVKALLEIKGAQAAKSENGVVTITGATTANAQVTATAADGATQTETADANGHFSVALKATGTVILKAALDGHTSEPTAVVAPGAASQATEPAAQAANTATKAETQQSSETSAAQATSANAPTAEKAAVTVDSAATTASEGNDAPSKANTAASDGAADQTAAAALPSSTGETTTLVDPSAADLAAAKAAAAAAYDQTGVPQTLQVLAAGNVAQSVFKTTDLTVETVDDKGETADKALPSGDFTGESKAEATFTVKGIDPSTDLAGDHVYVQVLVPKGINVTDANGEGQLNFTIDPYATLVAVMNYNSSAKPETIDDIKEHVDKYVSISGDTDFRNELNQKFTVQTPFATAATLTKGDNGTMITVDLDDVPNLTADLEQAFQGGINSMIKAWSKVPIFGLGFGAAANFGLGWWVGGDVAADPAKFLSSVIEKGILTDMAATVKSTLTVDKGTHVVTGDDPQPVTLKGAITVGKGADDLGTGAGTTKLYYVDQTDASGTSTGTDDPGDTTPTTDGFPVTYKYLDENGTEISGSAKTAYVAKDGEIDFNPLDPPSGYTFDPAKTTLDVGSVIANEIQSSFSGAKDFASLNSSMKTMGLTNPNQYTDYGSDELTITYKGTKAAQTEYVAWVKYVDEAGNTLLPDYRLGAHAAGITIKTGGVPVTVKGYKLKGENPLAVHYTYTDVENQFVTLTYEPVDGGTGTTDQTTTGTVKVKLVDTEGKVVTNDAGQTELSYSGTIGDPIVVPDAAKKVTGRSITGGGDGTLNKVYTEAPQELKITYTPVATKGTITVNLVDENNQPISNTDGKPSIDLEGNIGDPITSVTLNKDVPGHKITTDGTTNAKFTKTAQTLTIKYAPVETKGTITVKLVDENNQPIKNTDGQSSIDLKGNIGDSITSVALNKDVPGHKITTDGTTDAMFTKTAQTLTIKYATDGPRVFTPGNPGKSPDNPLTVTSRYLIGTLQADIVYTGEGAPAKKTGTPIKIYRTATLDASGKAVYTPWTTNPTGVGGSDTDVLVAPITESDIPPVANAVGTIVDETNEPITSAGLPESGQKSMASDGKTTLIDGSAVNVDKDLGKFVTNFVATRVVNYGANQPDLQWHDAPKDPTDPLYNDTHKVLHPLIMMTKDGVTTQQDNTENDIVLTRQYQTDNNDPDSGVKGYGEWTVDDTGKFMTSGYVPVIYDGYKASPAKIDQDTQDDDHKTVTEELAAMAAETADQDKEITFTINYDKEKAELVEHPAPNEPGDVNYDDTHKFLNVTINGDQNGQKKLLETGKVEFTRTYYTEEGDTTNKVVKYGDWKQTAPFATFTPESVDGAKPTPAQVTETTVGDDGQSIKQAAAGLLAAADDEDKNITITVTYTKAEAAQGTGTVHYVYQNVGGIELQPPVTVSGPEGTDYSTQYKIPDTLNSDGKDLPDAGGTLDTSILYYYATADINGGQINSLPDNGSADAAFKTNGQDIWVIYVAKPKASAADTVTAEEIEGDADHPNGGTRITVKHVDGSPDTVTTVWNGNDGVTPVVDPNGTDNGDGTTTYQITADGQPAGSFTVKNGEKGKDGVDGQTPQIKTTNDGKIVFYIPGSKGDGTNDTMLAEIDAPKSGDTITATPAGVTEDHPNGGTTITVTHGDGSADTVTTVWNGNDGVTPTIEPTKDKDGNETGEGFDIKVNGQTVATLKNGVDGKTPEIKAVEGKDGKTTNHFVIPGDAKDGSDDVDLGEVPTVAGDTISVTDYKPADGNDKKTGYTVTITHANGTSESKDLFNGKDGATPTLEPTKDADGNVTGYDIKVNGETVGTLKNGVDGKTPEIKAVEGKDGKTTNHFVIPGDGKDGSKDIDLGEVPTVAGDTISVTDYKPADGNDKKTGYTVTITHANGNTESKNLFNGETPTLDPIKDENGK